MMHCGLHVTMHVALVISSIVGISDNVSVLILSFAFSFSNEVVSGSDLALGPLFE